MSDRSDHPSGITTRSVASGYVAHIEHGDGSSTGYWGPTEQQARDRAIEGAT